MKALREYYKMQSLSLRRYIQSFPLLFRIMGFLILIFSLFLLYRIEITDVKSAGVVVAVYVLLSLLIPLKKTEKLFLHNYRISVRFVWGVRAVALSLPVFLIHWKIGFLCSIAGILLATIKPYFLNSRIRLIKFRPAYFFLKPAFQWHSYYRSTGFLVHCLGIFIMSMGVIHDNSNLSLVALTAIGVVVGIGAVLPSEPVYFVKTYLFPKQLIRKKTVEILLNLFILQFPLAFLLLFFGINIGHLVYCLLSAFVLSWISFAVKYSGYPDDRLPLFLLFIIVLPLAVFCLVAGSWMWTGVPLILLHLCLFTILADKPNRTINYIVGYKP